MTINIKGTDYELKFTYNSFRYMEDFNVEQLSEIETKPFKVIGIATELVYGVANASPTKFIPLEDCSEFIESVVDNGDIMELVDGLMEALQESNFFKSLQKNPEKAPRKVRK